MYIVDGYFLLKEIEIEIVLVKSRMMEILGIGGGGSGGPGKAWSVPAWLARQEHSSKLLSSLLSMVTIQLPSL